MLTFQATNNLFFFSR